MKGLSIYKSSAGSGKTYTLVKEYLMLLLENPRNYRHILGITFTNKTAKEMRNRIIDALAELSGSKNSNLEKTLIQKWTLTESITASYIQKQATEALSLILHDYSYFAINTIDSFFYKIIRSIAKEIHLPYSLEIEMDSERVIEEVIDNLLGDIESNVDLAHWLEDLLLSKVNEDKGWNIKADLKEMCREIFKENPNPDKKEISNEEIKEFVRELRVIKKTYESEITKQGQNGVEIIAKHELCIADFSHGEKGVASIFPKAIHDPGNFVAGPRALAAQHNSNAWSTAKSPNKMAITRATEELIPVLQKMIGLRETNYHQYNTSVQVLKNIYLLGIQEDIQRNLRKFRDENRQILISDVTRMLENLISDSDAPFVYEKTGSILKHFLFDEFQDTSGMQWKNFLPLVTHSLSEGNFVMMVGDAKQSIYRWRNGDVRLLLEGVKKNLSNFRELISEKFLDTNFRSKKEVVEFNNAFFTEAKIRMINALHEDNLDDTTLIELAYQENGLLQKVAEKNKTGGFVQVCLLNTDKDMNPNENEKNTEEIPERKIGWKEKSLQQTLSTIKKLQEDNYTFGDIAILVRSNAQGAFVTRYLLENGISNIVSPDSLFLSASPKIRFLISILEFFKDKENAIAKSHILFHFRRYIQNTETNDLHSTFIQFTKEKKTIFTQGLPKEFADHTAFLSKLPIFELAENLIRIFNLNQAQDAFVNRFLEVIFEFSLQNEKGISGFLKWWEINESSEKCSLLLPETKQAITIMTIHKSKGLQFPAVILPFTEWNMGPETNKRTLIHAHSNQEPFHKYSPFPVTLSKALEESSFKKDYEKEITQIWLDHINLTYVAFTRAEDRLYIFSPKKKTDSSSTIQGIISQTMIDTEICKSVAEDVYERGQAVKLEAKESSIKFKDMPIRPDNFISTPWQSRITVSAKGKKQMQAYLQDGIEGVSAIDYGLIIHDLLQHLKTTKDIPRLLAELEFEGRLNSQQKEETKKLLEKITTSSETAFLFSEDWHIVTERDIIYPDNTVLRPDRVMIKGKTAIVVDYKTNQPDATHHEQVNQYAKTLEEMGYQNIAKYILYIRKNAAETFLVKSE